MIKICSNLLVYRLFALQSSQKLIPGTQLLTYREARQISLREDHEVSSRSCSFFHETDGFIC